jgi:hypothetical protein
MADTEQTTDTAPLQASVALVISTSLGLASGFDLWALIPVVNAERAGNALLAFALSINSLVFLYRSIKNRPSGQSVLSSLVVKR